VELKTEELNSVDRRITVSASREDFADQLEAAYRRYRTKLNLPGFRRGNIPVSVIRQRFGKEIESEEIGNFLDRVFKDEIAPVHNPIGEASITDLQWENDALEAVFLIGVEPTFELADLAAVSVKRMVHDVTDQEVEEEIKRSRERAGGTEEVDEKVKAEHMVVVDAQPLDEEGNPVPGEMDADQRIDLSLEGYSEFLKALKGKKPGADAVVTLGEGSRKERVKLTLKKVLRKIEAEMDEEFFKNQSNGEATDLDSFTSFLRSRIQQYYDQSSSRLFNRDMIDAVVDAHAFEVPDSIIRQVLDSYLARQKERYGDKLPESFDEKDFRERNREQAVRESRWYFISRRLEDTLSDLEITAADIDAAIEESAKQYGLTAEQLKPYYVQDPSRLNSLRSSIMEEKLMARLAGEVSVTELSKDEYDKQSKKERETRLKELEKEEKKKRPKKRFGLF